MADVLVRGLPDDAKRRLEERARRRGVSLAAEMRDVLVASAADTSSVLSLRAAAVSSGVTDADVSALERVVAEARAESARDPLA